jgi:ABC-2 type transport system ATP-binding protein
MNSTGNANGEGDVVINAQEVTKMFGKQVAVDSLTMTVPRGSIFGFIGPSGCGKTTTIRMMTGVYRPTSGELRVLGKNPAEFTSRDREKIGYLTQQSVLFPELTAWENMNFVASLYGVGLLRGRRLKRLLEFVELSEDRGKLSKQLSGGMNRRLGLAAALIHRPQLLFLDEPTAGIDPLLRRKFWDYFKKLQEDGHTLFVTTQYVGEAAYCDLVGVMSAGRLLMVDTPEGLRKDAYGGEVVSLRTQEIIDRDQRKQFESLPFVRGPVKVVSDEQIELIVDEASTAMPQLIEVCKAAHLTVTMIEETIPSFDDVFVRIIETARADA